MSVQLVEVDTLKAARVRHQSLVARRIAQTIAIVVGAGYRIGGEVVYIIRKDVRHGRISRDPNDWVG